MPGPHHRGAPAQKGWSGTDAHRRGPIAGGAEVPGFVSFFFFLIFLGFEAKALGLEDSKPEGSNPASCRIRGDARL